MTGPAPTFATEVTALWGGRGSGKTTLARELIGRAELRRVVIIDPVAPVGWASAAEVIQALEAGSPRVVLRSSTRAVILQTLYAAFLHSSPARPVYAVCDEAPAYLDKSTEGLAKLMFQGRHRAFGMMILGQRPTAVDAGIRSQAAVTYWLRLSDHRDQQIAAQALGPDRARELASFKPGQFIRHPPK